MDNVIDLKKELYIALQDSSEIVSYNAKLRDRYEKQEKKINREREQWDWDRKKWGKKLGGSKAENDIKSKKIRSLESMIEILEGKLTSAQKDVISIQNDSLKKESENLSLKSKIAELENIKSSLESKVNELKYLKSEAISKPIVGGDDEKNMTKPDDISAISEPSKNISQYFLHGKNMDQAGKIDTICLDTSSAIIPDHTDDKSTSIPEESVIRGSPPSVDTEIIPKVSDKIDISKTNNNILQEIPNTPSLIESNTQMGPGPGIGAIPIVAYIFLTLLIIAVMWFVRRTWGFERKSDRLRDMWIGH
nr:13138_t:CDS:1 [Entrophospora candida]